MSEKYIIGVDIGGTKIAAGIVAAEGATWQVVQRIVLPSLADQPGEIVVGQIFKAIDTLLQLPIADCVRQTGFAWHWIEEPATAGQPEIRNPKSEITVGGIGVVAPGPIDPQRGEIIYAPNIPSLRNIPIARLVTERYHLRSLIENDANAAGLAEAMFGAGTSSRYVFYVTVSTGIGTGLVIDRRIYGGKNGMAVEAGHVRIDYRGPECSCGRRGCIEAFASGTAMARRTRERLMGAEGQRSSVAEEPTSPPLPSSPAPPLASSPSRILDLAGGDLEKITPIVVAKAAREGDPLAREIIRETAEYLSIWLGGMINVFDPDIIIIGGGVSEIGDLLFDVIRRETPKHSIIPKAAEVKIVPAKLQKDVGILGAAALFAKS